MQAQRVRVNHVNVSGKTKNICIVSVSYILPGKEILKTRKNPIIKQVEVHRYHYFLDRYKYTPILMQQCL